MKKFLVFVIFIPLIFIITACSPTTANHNAIKNIKETINKTQSIVKMVNAMPKDSLVIPEIMDENTQTEIDEGTGYNDSTFTSGTNISKYVAKLYTLSNTAQKSINLNNKTEYLISCINSKSTSLKGICENMEKRQTKISKDSTFAITDLCNGITDNSNKLNNSKDDVKNNANEIVVLKRNYTSNVDKLSGKYDKLINSLNTRNLYLNNICYNLDKVYDILIGVCYPNINGTNEQIKTTWSNIDTYRNSKQKYNEYNGYNTQYPQNNYAPYNQNNRYGYGYGGTNPFYSYGMLGGMGGIGGYSRYPYSPYTNYNPYIPNIDTFGSYKNIDTYKPVENEFYDRFNDDKFYSMPFYPYGNSNFYEQSLIFGKDEENSQESEEFESTSHVKKVDDKPKIEKLLNDEKELAQ